MVVHMHAKMISPWKRPNSANYWFRLAVLKRYQAKIGQTEIKQSLRTTDAREARQLCGILQGEWLTKFAALDAILIVEAGRSGIEIVDAFFDFEAETEGGLDSVIAHELEGLAVAEGAYLDAVTTEEIVGTELARTMVLPLAEPAYPAYRGPVERKLIATRQTLFDERDAARLLPGLEAARRALALRYWPIAANFLEDAFAHADRPLRSSAKTGLLDFIEVIANSIFGIQTVA